MGKKIKKNKKDDNEIQISIDDKDTLNNFKKNYTNKFAGLN